MAFIYIQSERTLWTVGHHRPDGRFEPESDWGTPQQAARRAAILNGADPERVGKDWQFEGRFPRDAREPEEG